MKKIVWLAVSCLMVAALLVTSCGGAVTDEDINGDEGDGNGVVNGGDGEEEEEEEVDTEGKNMVVNTAGKLVERPRYGGYYHITTTTDQYRFDDTTPGTSSAGCSTLKLTNNELFTGDWAKGSQGTGESSWTIGGVWYPHLETGCLATSYELPDNETIIYHIRQGVHWQNKPPVNGREMDAHDVAFSLWRAYNRPGAYLNGTYPQDWVNGPQAINAIDDWTVEVSNIPAGWQYPILASSSDFAIIFPPEMVEEAGGNMEEWQYNCGTGPFMLTDYVPVSSLTYERNPNYWMKNPLHPEDQLPYVDGIRWYIIPDATTSQAAFRVGKIEARPGQVRDDWQALMETRPELQWAMWPATGNSAIWMRLDLPELPYDDIRVRKALFYAIDHQEILDEYYEGFGSIICSPIADIPENAGMYTPLEELPEEVQKLYGYYPEEAIELLTEAGYPDGFSCTMLCSTEGLVPIIKDYWAKIGVDLTIDLRQSQVVSAVLQGTKKQEDMYYGATSGTTVLKWNEWRCDHPNNQGGFCDDLFQEVYDQININMLDWDKVRELCKSLVPHLKKQAYIIDIPNDNVYFLWWPWLKGWGGEITMGYYNTYNQMSYLWIDKELREEMVGFER